MLNRKVIPYIEKADVTEIQDLVMAVMKRYRQLFPEDEIIFASIPYDEPNRTRELERILEIHGKYSGLRG